MPDTDTEPKQSQLRRLLERPDARPRVSRAVASLLGVAVASIGVLGALVIWHLVRRGRLIRERLGPPRDVRLELDDEPDPEPEPGPDGGPPP
jgi:hypothetical protein